MLKNCEAEAGTYGFCGSLAPVIKDDTGARVTSLRQSYWEGICS